MGEIVPFSSAGKRRAPEPKPEGSAQILFFLGVRYCRHDEETTDAGPRRRGRSGATPRARRKKRA